MSKEFKLIGNEEEKAELFLKKHRHSDRTGGHIRYIFTPTEFGEGVAMRCNVCGQETDITDYSCWQ